MSGYIVRPTPIHLNNNIIVIAVLYFSKEKFYKYITVLPVLRQLVLPQSNRTNCCSELVEVTVGESLSRASIISAQYSWAPQPPRYARSGHRDRSATVTTSGTRSSCPPHRAVTSTFSVDAISD